MTDQDEQREHVEDVEADLSADESEPLAGDASPSGEPLAREPSADGTLADEPFADKPMPGDDPAELAVPAPAEPVAEDTADAGSAAAETAAAVGRHVRRIAQGAVAGARRAGSSLSEQTKAGFTAMRAVGKARREHAQAREELGGLEAQIERDQQNLEHREEVEASYEETVAEKTAERDDALQSMKGLLAQLDTENDKIGRLTTQLNGLKQDDEKRLRPYKKALDGAKDASDDANRRLSEAKRAARSAENAVGDLVKRRDGRIAQARRDADVAQRRLASLGDELTAAQRDPDVSSGAISKLRSEHAAEMARLSRARDDAAAAPADAQPAIDEARARLDALRADLGVAEKAADAAKRELKKRKQEHDAEAAASKRREDAVEDRLIEAQKEARRLKAAADQQQALADAAQAELDDVEAIHAHPEVTASLRDQVARNRALASAQRDQVDQLAATEQSMRRATRTSRLAFVLVVVAALIVAAVVLFMVAGAGK